MTQKQARLYTYPQLTTLWSATSPGSILDRHSGSDLDRRGHCIHPNPIHLYAKRQSDWGVPPCQAFAKLSQDTKSALLGHYAFANANHNSVYWVRNNCLKTECEQHKH
jgi:hypothetical protein